MPGEYDPAEELGLFPDRILVTNLCGFVLQNDPLRDVCARFIRNGAHFYDVVKRYDHLTAYVLGREEATAGNTAKWVIPFLKANGATDHLLKKAYEETLRFMPGSEDALRFISRMLPTFVSTSIYGHGWMTVSNRVDAPLCEVFCSQTDLDHMQFGRADARRMREMCETVTSLRIPKVEYELNVPMEIDEWDVKIIRTLDDILQNQIPELPAMSLMESSVPVTSHRKAYQLLEIRKQTNIDLDCTMYIGGDDTDYQCLDLVRDAGGAAVSFNGTDFAVRGCNIAIMSKESTVGAVFASLFYDRGIEAMMDLASNWERPYLKKCEFSDRNLLDRMLAANPRRLPEVHVVDRHNVDEVAKRSAEFRRKMMLGRRCGRFEDMVLRTGFEPVCRPRKGRMIGRYTTGASEGHRNRINKPSCDGGPGLKTLFK